jgi:diguanylate cyclase (GGDEF)-like protein
VNDLYGHDAGDRFLVEVARRLRANLRAVDVVARLGGDEFFVVLEDVQDEAAVKTIVCKLLAEAVRPYDLAGGAQARVSASIGVSVFPDNSADAGGLIKHADMAMYTAKQAGKNGYSFFSALNGPVLRFDAGRPQPAAVNVIGRGAVRASVAPPSQAASSSQEGE